MRPKNCPVEALVALAAASDASERSACWRRAVATLGQPGRTDRPPPLEGLEARTLVQAVQRALESDLVDDLAWASPAGAALALYELTSALPAGRERKELGRRIIVRLREGSAGTFAAVATRMATVSAKALESPAMRARVNLLYCLPLGTGVNADPLALTFLARPELFERWIAQPAIGTLPSRRMAAAIVERAAREVVRCTQLGDPGALAALGDARVQSVLDRLLADREPLVWRHAAVARGILAAANPSLREEIDLQLDPGLSPTQWRRAAVSLAACNSFDSDTAMPQCKALLRSELFERHPGVISTLLWGLGPVIEADPDKARELIDFVSWVDRPDIAQNLIGLLRDLHAPEIALAAAERMKNGLRDRLAAPAPYSNLLLSTLCSELDPNRPEDSTIADAVRAGLHAFEETGADAAHRIALGAVERAVSTLGRLENLGRDADSGATYGLLRQLDAGTIENSRLYYLLLLDRHSRDDNASVVEMERLYDRFGSWLLNPALKTDSTGDPEGAHLLQKQRWLTLLHLIDVETSTRSGSEYGAQRIAWRIQLSVRTLLGYLEQDNDSRLHRVFCATLARSFDAAVREGVADIADLLLLSTVRLHQPDTVVAVLEASTTADNRHVLQAYAAFLQRSRKPTNLRQTGPISLLPQTPSQRFLDLASGLRLNASHRGEALRQILLRISHVLKFLEQTPSLTDFVDSEQHNLDSLQQACADLKKLVNSAKDRVLGGELTATRTRTSDCAEALTELLTASLTAGEKPSRKPLQSAIVAFCSGLPKTLGGPLANALQALVTLPLLSQDTSQSQSPRVVNPLPDWLLPRRTIGGFYVVNALGQGGASSVFVARRIEARHQSSAELYALKVPKYDATVARSLSEQEFLEMFRQEAGALLALPKHKNLARFVNFDVEAIPKPILVMELIDGASLDRAVRRGQITVRNAFLYLDGVLEGLEAMHAVGVGHLDVKPANIILRDEATAVLVDFGLSGRQLRPGCGTLEYCSPEILGVTQEGFVHSPASADMYAFACLAYETLTSRYLVDGRDEAAVISGHLQHDGWPPALKEFSQVEGTHDLAVLLARCLRKDPAKRPSATEVRRAMAMPAHDLESCSWPLAISRHKPRSSSIPIPLVR